jgi:hypothetical protein
MPLRRPSPLRSWKALANKEEALERAEIEIEIEIVHSKPENWTGGHLSGHSTLVI